MDGIPEHGPCWVDVMSSDLDAAKRFYRTLFGWETTSTEYKEFGEYSMFVKDGIAVAGLGANSSGFKDSWTTYLAVEDIDATLAAVVKRHGKILMPMTDTGDFGKLAVIAGPGRAVVGLWQAGSFKGLNPPDAAGFPLWHTLNTYRFDEVFNFYCNVMGWRPQLPPPDAAIRYAAFQTGDSIRTAIFDAAAAGMVRPSRWWVSFGVPDVAAAVAWVEVLGGKVLVEPLETPFGKVALIADPGGAEFYVAEPGYRPILPPTDPWDISWVSEL